MKADQTFLVRHADLVFAFKTFAAAVLALAVALWMDLSRPNWARATAYITSQPLAGATNSKAFYRLVGTLIGAGLNIIDLRHACHGLSPRRPNVVDDMLDQLAAGFRNHVGGPMPLCLADAHRWCAAGGAQTTR